MPDQASGIRLLGESPKNESGGKPCVTWAKVVSKKLEQRNLLELVLAVFDIWCGDQEEVNERI